MLRTRAIQGFFVTLLSASILGAQVPYTRLLHAEADSGSWLTYSGSYWSQRYSRLRQITRTNVAQLRPAWVYQAPEVGGLEATPLVVDGVLYLTEANSVVTALDVRTGRPLWRWRPTLPGHVRTIGFGPVNRGVAILERAVFVGTLDAHLVALDATSGAVRWDVVVADNAQGYAITSAPLALNGKVIIGVSGGEAGIRGFLDAYDAATGKRVWRFWTIPGPGEPGHETWADSSWQTGGGPTWLSGSYDPDLDIVYWGVGNPSPDWNGDSRAGDNLYTGSLIALDAATGRLRWYFQFTPHDTHDWDANQIPVLIDVPFGGRMRKVVATANRNGFFYLLDRATGEFLLGTPFAHLTWATALDARGRPNVVPGSEPSVEGSLVYPSLQGATNWFSPAFSPMTGLFYVPVREMGSYYRKGEAQYTPGAPFMAGGETIVARDSAYGAVRALDVRTGERRWEFRLPSPLWAGVLATAGGLVFGCSNEGNFYALDAATGQALWDFQTGGVISANPMTFLVDGRQYVAIASSQALFVFTIPR